MISQNIKNKLLHDVKRAAKVIGFIKDESDHEKRQVLLGLLQDEYDRMAEDIHELPVIEDTKEIK